MSQVARDCLCSALAEAARRAFSRHHAPVVHHLRLASDRISLRFATESLAAQMMAALSVIEDRAHEQPADVVLDVWDTESTSVPFPHLDRVAARPEGRGEVVELSGDDVWVAYQAASASWSALDLRARRGAFVTASSALPLFEIAAPLRTLLGWWSTYRGRHVVHAAAVGTGGRGVLLAGKGGSGKSTSAVTALLAGMSFVGDDFCLVDTDGVRPTAHALFASAKLTDDARHRLGLAPAADVVTDGTKSMLPLRDHPLVVRTLEVRALVVPTVAGGTESVLRPLSRGRALIALAPSTLGLLPFSSEASLRFMRCLVERLPCYALSLATDYDRVPRMLMQAASATFHRSATS